MRNLAAFVIALLVSVSVDADESRIPVSAPVPTTATIVINAPGTYVLTRNITSTASPVVSIQSNQVTFDLNGRTITNNGSGATFDLTDATDIAIHNGFLTGGQVGINRPSFCCGRLTLENVTIADTTSAAIKVTSMTATTIRSCRMVNTNTAGTDISSVFINGGTAHIVDNQILTTSKSAIYLGSFVFSAQIERNIIRQFNTSGAGGNSGVRVEALNALIGHNTIEGSGSGSGVSLAGKGSQVEHNNIAAATFGIVLQSRGQFIHGNVIRENDYGVFIISPEGSENLIEDNQIQGNSNCALFCDQGTDNAYRNNMLKGNASAICGAGFIDAGGNIL